MKQGNSESDQPPDFVCFRKVVQGQPSEFCMFSEKNRIFEKKKSDLRGKKVGISFFPECFITIFFFK